MFLKHALCWSESGDSGLFVVYLLNVEAIYWWEHGNRKKHRHVKHA